MSRLSWEMARSSPADLWSVRSPGCRLYNTKTTSGRIYYTVNPPRLWMSYAGLGRRCRLSTQKATWRTRLLRSHQACATC